MLKSDLHIHTNYIQKNEGHYSPEWLINKMSECGYEVLALTEHASLNGVWKKEIYPDALKTYLKFKDYAKKKNILLIPGVEKHIEGREVLILNYKEFNKLKTFDDLEKVKDENGLVIAPHPFYPMGIGDKLIENIKLFDALEYTVYYLRGLNFFNKKTEKIAREYRKTLIANSDAHWKFQLNRNFSFIDAEKTVDSVLEAIRRHKVKIQTKPLSIFEYGFTTGWVVQSKIRKLFKV